MAATLLARQFKDDHRLIECRMLNLLTDAVLRQASHRCLVRWHVQLDRACRVPATAFFDRAAYQVRISGPLSRR